MLVVWDLTSSVKLFGYVEARYLHPVAYGHHPLALGEGCKLHFLPLPWGPWGEGGEPVRLSAANGRERSEGVQVNSGSERS